MDLDGDGNGDVTGLRRRLAPDLRPARTVDVEVAVAVAVKVHVHVHVHVHDDDDDDQRVRMFGFGGAAMSLPIAKLGWGGWLYATFCQEMATRYCGSCISV